MTGYSCWKLWTRFIKQINAPPWRKMYTLPFTVPSLQYLSPAVVVNYIARRQSDHKTCKYSYPAWLTEEGSCNCSRLLYTFFQMLGKNGDCILFSHLKKDKLECHLSSFKSRSTNFSFSGEFQNISIQRAERTPSNMCCKAPSTLEVQ